MKLKEQLVAMGLTEELAQRVIGEVIDGDYIPKSRFNEINEENKTLKQSISERDNQLKTLQKNTGNAEALQQQIADLQKQNSDQMKQYKADIEQLKINNAVESALIAAKAKNVKAVKALLELTDAELSEDGTVKGLSEQISALATGKDTGFLFDTGNKKSGTFKGVNPDEGSDGNASGSGKAPKDMTYDELCAYLADNPNTTL